MHKKNSQTDNALRNIEKVDAIRIRHAGVLGLCAFIRAHPYDVPKYVPSVFEHLGFHMNDPQPIPVIFFIIFLDFFFKYFSNTLLYIYIYMFILFNLDT